MTVNYSSCSLIERDFSEMKEGKILGGEQEWVECLGSQSSG